MKYPTNYSPAFPATYIGPNPLFDPNRDDGSPNQRFTRVESPGMSLRDYFAAQALIGMCSGVTWPRLDDGPEMAKRAYAVADAMLVEREKESA